MAKKVAPIKPGEITKAKKVSFPAAVLRAFNELIVKHMSGKSASFRQDEVIELIMAKMHLEGNERNKIFDNNWLDVEAVYRAEGWIVEYDKPGFNETYPATFTFRSK
ncbi:MAG: hypothetical protein HY226_03550 [Candidatus Vogelbacteria bacterium]|nr:hypothetical protein [Candidatus Vogelbacteria bacterium]